MAEVNVLIIEDKKEDAVFLESIVKSLGYKVWIASSKDEAAVLFALLVSAPLDVADSTSDPLPAGRCSHHCQAGPLSLVQDALAGAASA